jgi:hypothetical protein
MEFLALSARPERPRGQSEFMAWGGGFLCGVIAPVRATREACTFDSTFSQNQCCYTSALALTPCGLSVWCDRTRKGDSGGLRVSAVIFVSFATKGF